MRSKVFLFILLFCCPLFLFAQLRLPAIFGDHMVLQQQSEVAIWGWSSPGGEVTVAGSWDNDERKAAVDNAGFWKTTLTTPKAGGPYRIAVTSNQKIELDDVMIGEVWVCSGQSNMEWSMTASEDGRAAVDSANESGIRLFHPAKLATAFPQVHGEGEWRVTTPESVRGFSAVGYFFGRKLHGELEVPIGLINVSWGGTPADVWIPAERVTQDETLAHANSILREDRRWPKKPGVVFNGMIHPLLPFGIAGAIWYQGEGNTGAPLQYKDMMEQLILSWRDSFEKDFPFYYVQIAPFSGYGDVETGSLVREQQVKMLEIPNTGMVVISDHVDDVNDIHPKFKRPVGERLANLALSDTYDRNGIAARSPVFKTMEVKKNKARIVFEHAGAGLVSRGGAPTEFYVAGDDKKFYPAKAKIEGSSVVVWSREVKNPVAVRFAWANGAIPNLFSKEGLPVSLFRTDDWPVLE